MPTINAGSSATVALLPGRTLAFNFGAGNAQVVPPEPASVAPTIVPVGIGTTVGPFDQAVSVFVLAAQLTDYEIWQARDVLARDGSLALTAEQAAATRALTAGTVTWANRPTNPSLYDQIFVTDIGPNGTQFWWNGSRWKVLYPSVIGENGNIVTGVAQIADQYLGAGFGPFPVGLLQVGDTFCYQFALGKDAALDTYGTATSIRFGQNGTVVDAVIAGINLSGVIVAASRAGPGFEKYFRVVSANTIRPIGVISAVSSFNGLSVGNTDAATTVGIINITTTPWRIGVSTNMNAGTAAPQITYQRLTLLP